MPGSGHIDFDSIVRCLKDIGYRGYASFEPNIASRNYERDTRKGLEFMKQIETRKAAAT
jgi:sugar phosphate isomerase/epimerase